MLRKVVKLLLLFVLLWILSISFIIRKLKYTNQIISTGHDDVNEIYFNRVQFESKLKHFGDSGFRIWQMLPIASKKITLNEMKFIVKGNDRPPGVHGRPVILNKYIKTHIKEKVRKGWKHNAFNSFVSDLIPVNRTLPDPRDPWCKNKTYSNKLPKATIIICFHNEAWSTLLRTVHSVINRSPDYLLEETILVDDFSTMSHLKKPLDKYIKSLPKVKLLRAQQREGLIRARILGVRHAKASIVVFLDSHCECSTGWLEPLLERIHNDPTTVVSPVVDHIHVSTFEYIAQDIHDLRIGGFTWDLKFSWITIPYKVLSIREHDASPVKTPTISGGLFAIDKTFFEKLGYYDEEFDIWGAENLELSFKTWMCGGSLEFVPCSHVGHVFRNRFPYKGLKGSSTKNSMRLAEVWLDEYSKYFYERLGNHKVEYGNVSKRKDLRNKLNCNSFKWYLEKIYPQMIIPNDYVASGQIRSLNYDDWCLDSSTRYQNLQESVNLLSCHHQGGNQYWVYTKHGEIRRDDACLDYMFSVVTLYICRGHVSPQRWLYEVKTQRIRHMKTQLCLTTAKFPNGYKIILQKCVNSYNQKWMMDNFIEKGLAPEVTNYVKGLE